MSLQIGDVTALLRLAAGAGVDAKGLLRLVSVELLKDLGNNRYLVRIDGKELEAQSERPLKAGERFWAEVSRPDPKAPLTLQHLLQKPAVPEMLSAFSPRFDARSVETMLRHGDAATAMKEQLLTQLAAASNKEEFTALTQLVLSLQQGVFTVPLFYERYLGFFQMKKRYNKQNKKASVAFYAALENLGPLEGMLFMNGPTVEGSLMTAFESSAAYLRRELASLSGGIQLEITVKQQISALFEPKNTLLDISI